MERRYVRLAGFISKQYQDLKINILVQERAKQSIFNFLPNGHNVEVISFGGIKHNRGRAATALRDVPDLLVKLRQIEHDHLHIIGNPGLITGMISMLQGKISPVSFSMTDGTFSVNATFATAAIASLGVRGATTVDCLSTSTKDILKNFVGDRYWGKLHVAPCSFTDYEQVVETEERDIDVLIMARFVTEKGYDLLEEIHQNLSHLNVHVCGFGPLELTLPSFKVYKSNNPFELMARSKIFLSLQKRNNYPSQSTLEAMASGCAIVATDVGETRKFLDEACAVMIPYDASALDAAVNLLLENPQLSKNLCIAAKKRALTEHTVGRYAEYFLEKIIDFDCPHYHRP
jgi:glycosyltransferase involved in cell wall biosynthesis